MAATRETPGTTNAADKPGSSQLGRLPIAVVLAAGMGLLVLLAVVSVLAIQWSANRKNTLDLLNRNAVLMIEMIEMGVRNHLDPAIDQIEAVARQIETGALDPADRTRLGDLLIGALAATPQISLISTWDADLRQFAIRREEDGALSRIEADWRDDARLARAAAQAAGIDGTFWGELVFRNGTTLINLRRALRRDGAVIGLMASAVTVPELSQLVTEIGDLFETTAFILSGRQQVLAHPFLTAAHPEQTTDSPTVPLGSVGDIVLGSLWSGIPMRGFEQAAAEQVHVVRITLGGHDYVAAYRWIDDYGDHPWALGAWFPLADVGAELERLRLSGLAGLVVLLAAILAAVLLGRLIAKPIRRAAANAARVGEFELDHVETLASSGIRELNDQARAFNAMLAGLRSFETYVPRSLVLRLIRTGEAAGVASQERELTVMFTDVVGFTAMSEGLPAGEIARFLNQHFSLLASCVEAEGGTIDKFIGDALMAFWGAPDKQKDRAVRASRAALAMADAIAADNARRSAAGEAPIRIRIGIHTGPVVVGNIGSPGRINYTIVGDTVNTGQRLEGLGKELDRGDPVTILISGITAERLDGRFRTEPAGSFEVKGKKEPIEVYRLLP